MLQACFTPIALCFLYTSWRFYAFSGTNLLTRCHSASSCFLLFLCFKKVTRKIFSELDETKPEPPIFPDTGRSPKESRRGPGGWHTMGWRGCPWPRHHQVWGPVLPSDIALPPIKGLRRENPKKIGISPSKVPQRRRRRRPISRTQVSIPAPCQDGEVPRSHLYRLIASTAVSIDFTAISIDIAVSHDEEGVVLPRG
jgi:hypothetical protein